METVDRYRPSWPICKGDFLEKGKAVYRFQMVDDDDCDIKLNDGRRVVFLSANLYDEVESEDLRSLLKYVNDGAADAGSKLVSRLHRAVTETNEDEECMMYMSAADEARYYQRVIDRQDKEIELAPC